MFCFFKVPRGNILELIIDEEFIDFEKLPTHRSLDGFYLGVTDTVCMNLRCNRTFESFFVVLPEKHQCRDWFYQDEDNLNNNNVIVSSWYTNELSTAYFCTEIINMAAQQAIYAFCKTFYRDRQKTGMAQFYSMNHCKYCREAQDGIKTQINIMNHRDTLYTNFNRLNFLYFFNLPILLCSHNNIDTGIDFIKTWTSLTNREPTLLPFTTYPENSF